LAIHVTTVVVDTKVVGLEPLEASRRNVTNLVTDLTDWPVCIFSAVTSITTLIAMA
jgi:hypothetical protein